MLPHVQSTGENRLENVHHSSGAQSPMDKVDIKSEK